MLGFIAFAATISAVVLGFVKTREFVRNRLRYVEAVHSSSAPFKAGGAAMLLAAPVVWLLPVINAPAAIFFGIAVGAGVVAGRKDIRNRLPSGS
jgi:hypothetical protein